MNDLKIKKMSDPTIEQRVLKLQKYIRFLINQPIQEFQEQQGIKITSIEFDMIDLSTVGAPVSIIAKVILRFSE